MGTELKVSAYGLSSTSQELNLDNMYINGRYVNVGSDTQSSLSKVTSDEFQVYGVSDSKIGSLSDKNLCVQCGYTVMNMLQREQRSLSDAGKIDKNAIWQSMVEANRAIRQKKNEVGLDALGSSFAALFLHGNRGLAVHLGDSRIYVIRGGRMLQITDDHLESSDMFRLGILTQAQAEVHKKDSALTAYMGMDDIYDSRADAFSKYFIFYPGDTVLICTDGLSDAIMNDEMERIVRLLKDATVNQTADMLMKAAAEKSQEDMTLVVIHVDDAPGDAPVRGTSTIPKKENYETRPAVRAKPAASASSDQGSSSDGDGYTQEPSEEEEEGEEGGGGFFAKVGGFFKRNKSSAEEDEEDENPQDDGTPHLSRYDEPDEEEEEEPSFWENLKQDPKRLAIVIACIVAAILLLILIVSAIAKSGSSGNSSSRTSSSSSSLVSSSTSVSDLLPSNQSSTVSQVESSSSSSSSETSSSSQSSSQSGPTEVVEYTIQEGDSWSAIMVQYYGFFDVDTCTKICEYNNLEIDSTIYPGDVVKLPPLSELE